jgi:hypothetical protein
MARYVQLHCCGSFANEGNLISLLKHFATVGELAALVTRGASELFSATKVAALLVDGGVVKAIV